MEKKYNNVQQQNEGIIKKNKKLIKKINLLSDLNAELQVQINSLRKENQSFPTDAMDITYSNLPDINQDMVSIFYIHFFIKPSHYLKLFEKPSFY